MKILLPAILIIALMALVVLLGLFLLLIFVMDITYSLNGIPSILAFLGSAALLGTCIDRVINIIKTILK